MSFTDKDPMVEKMLKRYADMWTAKHGDKTVELVIWERDAKLFIDFADKHIDPETGKITLNYMPISNNED